MTLAAAKTCLRWVHDYVAHNSDVSTSHGSLKKCFADGKAFLVILNCINPLYEYEPSANPMTNMRGKSPAILNRTMSRARTI